MKAKVEFQTEHQHQAWQCGCDMAHRLGARDTTLDALDWARGICRVAASEAKKAGIKRALAAAKTVAATEHLARADRRITATVEQWDADPDLFNTEPKSSGHDGGT